MDVDTGAFQALSKQVEALAAQVADLGKIRDDLRVHSAGFFVLSELEAVWVERGRQMERDARAGQRRTGQARRPEHLRPVRNKP